MIGRFLTSALWGIAADKYGRKPVMIIGVISVVIFNTLFGLSINFWMAMTTRFLLGSFNGLLGPLKAYASEICRDEHQALGLSIVATMWGIGLIIGPAIGGFLSEPAETFPNLITRDSLFGRFPYFLPCLCISLIALGVLCTTLLLPETIHKHPLECVEKEAQSVGSGKSSLKAILRNWAAMSSIIVYCIFALHDIAYTEIFSLWAESPQSYGGLGFSSSDVGIVLAITGAGVLVIQIFVFPRIANAVGAILTTRTAAALSIPVLATYPFLAKLPGTLQWFMVVLASLVKNILARSTYTAMFLLLNNSVAREQRGAANGISMTGMSLFKAIGPATAGCIFSWSQKRRHASFLPGDSMVFFLLIVVIVTVVIMTFEPFLPRSTDRPPSKREVVSS
eukprot:TRINITY_DN6823_c0_g1_i3.p1 TRINITY_DN6823_c0_g1~~TRINITY_DN6823_c0_g1_i3.p1  ORF type:complete len:394 (+),score=54.15 TRINITY_DN6823_c0_g1_i3:463-1644(+)